MSKIKSFAKLLRDNPYVGDEELYRDGFGWALMLAKHYSENNGYCLFKNVLMGNVAGYTAFDIQQQCMVDMVRFVTEDGKRVFFCLDIEEEFYQEDFDHLCLTDVTRMSLNELRKRVTE